MESDEWLSGRYGGVEDDSVLAARLAEDAGRLLLDFRSEALAGGLPQSELKDEGDARSQALMASVLRYARPGDSVLSEEARDNPARVTADRVWIIDPLDGTREFSEDRHDWAVHVALWAGGRLAAGAVALPGVQAVLATGTGTGSGSSAAQAPLPGSPLRIAVSRSRAPQLVSDVAGLLGAELVPMGSAGFKASAVIRGEVDAYVHAGGQYEWDSAAPVAVALAQGLHASRIDGSELRYNQPDPYLPDLLVCRAAVAGQLLTAIDQVK